VWGEFWAPLDPEKLPRRLHLGKRKKTPILTEYRRRKKTGGSHGISKLEESRGKSYRLAMGENESHTTRRIGNNHEQEEVDIEKILTITHARVENRRRAAPLMKRLSALKQV